MSHKFDNGTEKVHGNQFSPKLGKMLLYGEGRRIVGASHLRKGIEVDQAKIEIIEKLLPLTSVKGVRSFLGHAGFYRRFIRDFSKISKPFSNLLMQGVPFDFNDSCVKAFETLKEKLILAPIIVAPD